MTACERRNAWMAKVAMKGSQPAFTAHIQVGVKF
jgi:hypothetical protein